MVERDLNEREKAGVPDAVLLEDFTNEDVFLENLEKRFHENIIYVRSLLSVNPFRDVIKTDFLFVVKNNAKSFYRPISVKC